jgi:hypothetical protein
MILIVRVPAWILIHSCTYITAALLELDLTSNVFTLI